MENKPKAGPKDVFLQLLSIITLYVSAGALIDILFSFIEILFPDVLTLGYVGYSSSGKDSMRFSISLLVIIFPAYLFINWLLSKGYKVDPEKKNLKIRKWLMYFTLSASALILLGDLVVLVNNLLNGDVAVTFLLKVLSVFLVIGSIFFYYFQEVRKTSTD